MSNDLRLLSVRVDVSAIDSVVVGPRVELKLTGLYEGGVELPIEGSPVGLQQDDSVTISVSNARPSG